jgi:hypothetical protein
VERHELKVTGFGDSCQGIRMTASMGFLQTLDSTSRLVTKEIAAFTIATLTVATNVATLPTYVSKKSLGAPCYSLQ